MLCKIYSIYDEVFWWLCLQGKAMNFYGYKEQIIRLVMLWGVNLQTIDSLFIKKILKKRSEYNFIGTFITESYTYNYTKSPSFEGFTARLGCDTLINSGVLLKKTHRYHSDPS